MNTALYNKTQLISDTTQVPNIGRVSWQAEICRNEITSIELKSNQVTARMAFDLRGGINKIEIARGAGSSIRIAFDDDGGIIATQNNQPVNGYTAREAMTVCYHLLRHAAVHRKVSEVMVVGART